MFEADARKSDALKVLPVQDDSEMQQGFGRSAREHVIEKFSRPAFGRKLWSVIAEMLR